MKMLPSLLALASLSSCANTGAPAVEPLRGASDIAVRYSSRLSGAAGISRIAGPPERAEPIGTDQGDVQGPPGSRLVLVRCKIVEMDRGDARSMLGSSPCARRAPRDVAEEAFGALERTGSAKVITAPALTLFDGAQGDIEVADEQTFVEAFDFSEGTDAAGVERATIGDPIIATVSEGIRVEARTTAIDGGGAVRLELGLRVRDLLDSIPESTARLPGFDASVTVQQPLLYTQHLAASADLGPEDVLVVGGLTTPREGRVLVALVATRVAAPKTAAALPESARRGNLR
jgi:hypothetical protein